MLMRQRHAEFSSRDWTENSLNHNVTTFITQRRDFAKQKLISLSAMLKVLR